MKEKEFFSLFSFLIPFLTLFISLMNFNSRFSVKFQLNVCEKYKNPALPIEERVDDLLYKMTTEEKVGQLVQMDGRKNLEEMMKAQHVGSILNLIGDEVSEAIELSKQSRLQIPIIFGIDAIHGHSFWEGATIFPTQLGIAQSWDAPLMRKMAEITAHEMRHTGISWTFSPVLCIARDLRWGRVGETFGEDPYLIGLFASEMIKGYQGETLSNDPEHVLATAKHFAGYSETEGGRDASEADISRRKLLSYFLPPFKKAVESGVGSFMSGFQSIDGLPCSANPWLLHSTLRENWNFDGFVVTDWNNVGYLVDNQKICNNYEEASALAVKSGNDMIMASPMFYKSCLNAIKHGKLSIEDVEIACRRILKKKFQLGLFEDERLPDTKVANERNGTPENRAFAQQAAEESLVLVKNDGILPLKQEGLKVALVGPNADHTRAQLGDWALGSEQLKKEKSQPRECIVTVKDALEKRLGENLKYEPGAWLEENETYDYDAAIRIVKESDVAIIVVGDRLAYWGETKSTATLNLAGSQEQLIEGVAATGKPFIINVISSKPLILPKAAENASAIIYQFSPGMLGGTAFDRVVFGEAEPRGRLTITIPRHVGQQPIYYNTVRGQHGYKYADMSQRPMYEFGYGLTYTNFRYIVKPLEKEEFSKDEKIKIIVNVENTGERRGTEVVQAYLNDAVTSATWARIELKGFAIVTLEPGESKDVEIEIPCSECSIVNTNLERVVEPGKFNIFIGKSSIDIQGELSFVILY